MGSGDIASSHSGCAGPFRKSPQPRQLLNDVGSLNDLGLLVDRAAQEELTELLVEWLKQGGSRETSWQVPVETISRVVSWVIFGMAAQWSQEVSMRAREQMVNDFLL